MIAKILTVEPTPSGKGHRVTLEGGEKVYVFNQSFLNLIQPGAYVDLSLQQAGRWTQVIGVAPAYYGGAPSTSAPAQIPQTTPPPTTQPPGTLPQYQSSPQPQAIDVANQPGGGAIPGASAPTPDITPEPQFDNSPPAPFDKDSMIVRQSIIKAPVLAEMFKELTDETKNIEGVIDLIKRLEQFVYRGE